MKTIVKTPDPLVSSAFDIQYWKLIAIDKECAQLQVQREAIEFKISQNPIGIASIEEYEALKKFSQREATLIEAREELLTSREIDKSQMLRELQALRDSSDFERDAGLDRT